MMAMAMAILEAVLTMAPPPRLRISGMACFEQRKTPLTLTATMSRFHTVEKLRAAYPDLGKYLPEVSAPAPNPVATTDIMDSLRAAGWK